MRISHARLTGILKSKGMTIKEFGHKLGMSRQGAYDLMKRPYLKEDTVTNISKILSVDRKDFLEPEGNIYLATAEMLKERNPDAVLPEQAITKDEHIFSLQRMVISLQQQLIQIKDENASLKNQMQILTASKKAITQTISTHKRKN